MILFVVHVVLKVLFQQKTPPHSLGRVLTPYFSNTYFSFSQIPLPLNQQVWSLWCRLCGFYMKSLISRRHQPDITLLNQYARTLKWKLNELSVYISFMVTFSRRQTTCVPFINFLQSIQFVILFFCDDMRAARCIQEAQSWFKIRSNEK